MVHYAESAGCRRRELLAYFGESFPAGGCGGCDNCLEPRENYDGTLVAQKFLSCLYRIRQASHFGTGLNHVVDVLLGADTEKIRRWGHERLTTYGIGGEISRPEWAAVGRELIRLGHVAVGEGDYATLELTAGGLSVLKTRSAVPLTKPIAGPKARRVRGENNPACDDILFERLRKFRKHLADERGVPAYIIFGDTTLSAMARAYPQSAQAMDGLPGIGEKKRAEFGELFAAEIADYLQTNSRMTFA
jgi:ATP-dependent DNA helicase RecQ